jgi:beta propeller repeat protein
MSVFVFCGTSSAASDLWVSQVNAPAQGSPGKTVNVDTTVENNGDETSGNFQVGYFLQKEKEITKNVEQQADPSIYGNRIVWEEYRNQNWDIYMKDLSTGLELPICTNTYDQINPSIYGDIIVWEDYRNGDKDIYMLDLGTGLEKSVCNNPANQETPVICGDRVVWMDWRNANLDIYMMDLSTGVETPICTNTFGQYGADIYGDRVVWYDMRNANLDIDMMDLSTMSEFVVCSNSATQYRPAIYEDIIVWVDSRNGNWDIYMKDISTDQETSLCTDASDQYDPDIYGEWVVWSDYIDPDFNIYLMDLSNGVKYAISNKNTGEIVPVINGDNIVWEDCRNGNSDIYMSYDWTVLPESWEINDLEAGEAINIDISITLPSDLKIGENYYLGAFVDPAQIVTESDEINNSKVDSTALTVPNIDLQLKNIYKPSSAVIGEYVLVPNTIWNNGPEKAGQFTVKYYLSTDSTITSSDVYLGSKTISGLAGKKSSLIYMRLKIPLNVSGNYYLGAVVDSSNAVVETNEFNNTKATSNQINIKTRDIAITSLTAPTTATRGKKVNVNYTIKNSGTESVSNASVNYYLSKDTKFSSSDTFLGSLSISMSAGASSASNISLNIPSTVAKGTYYIIAVADEYNTIVESNETNNNKVSSKITVN